MLDDQASLSRVDRSGLLGTLFSLPEQLEDGFRLCSDLELGMEGVRRLVVAGMGGSAIAGDLAASMARHSTIEVLVVRGYELPRFVDPRDVLVLVSYSGNTRETLSVYRQGLQRGLRCIAVSSGGELKEVATARGDVFVRVPSGLPPRSALGYLLAPLIKLLGEGATSLEEEVRRALDRLNEARQRWAPSVPSTENKAKALALSIGRRAAVVYAVGGLMAAARRWQTQLNENAKALAWSGALTEMCHNEVVGWMEDPGFGPFLPIVIRGIELEEERRHVDALIHLLRSRLDVEVVEAASGPPAAQILELVLLGDLVSVYLAVLREVDPLPVRPIEELKRAL